jgi:hypothetical protein
MWQKQKSEKIRKNQKKIIHTAGNHDRVRLCMWQKKIRKNQKIQKQNHSHHGHSPTGFDSACGRKKIRKNQKKSEKSEKKIIHTAGTHRQGSTLHVAPARSWLQADSTTCCETN